KLDLLACDNNSGLDGKASALSTSVEGGRTNFIVVDGVNAASGTLKLNCSLVAHSTLSTLSLTSPSAYRLTGYPAMRFTIETSADLVNWAALLTTNSDLGVFDFSDPGGFDPSQSFSRRFYRAVMIP